MVRVSIFIVVVLIIIVLGSAGTPIGRAMLPRSVTDAVSKLLPRALIRDATANADGETIVLVGDQSNPKNVYVRRERRSERLKTLRSNSRS